MLSGANVGIIFLFSKFIVYRFKGSTLEESGLIAFQRTKFRIIIVLSNKVFLFIRCYFATGGMGRQREVNDYEKYRCIEYK